MCSCKRPCRDSLLLPDVTGASGTALLVKQNLTADHS
jgi:hypothetical protein